MRKLIYFTMVSLDGFISAQDSDDNWLSMDEELHRFLNNLSLDTGADIYGRKMYELMQSAWPTAESWATHDYEIEFSHIWKRIPKVVFSKTLERVEGNARLVRGDPVEEVKKLKAEDGKPLSVGGTILASTLIKAGLVDEYQIFIHPVILGAGTRMILNLNEQIKLRLVETRRFGSGVMYLGYERNTGAA